jgi:uncharacterized protein (DUF488 family)
MTQHHAFDLLTIGHSNLAADRFVALVKTNGVEVIADVRSVPFSRRFPWFSGKALAERLAQDGIDYAACGDVLGGRPRDPALYCDGVADYEAMAARDDFRAGLDRVVAEPRCLCLMCAEREPLDCHRCLLVARSLTERGIRVGHILVDGTVEPQVATEDRLLALVAGKRAQRSGPDLFDPDPADDRGTRLTDAYRRRARAVRGLSKALNTPRP